MTRREFFSIAAAGAVRPVSQSLVIVPVHLLLDGRVKWRPAQLSYFWSYLWPQAVRDFERGGIHFETTIVTGDIWRPPRREPVITGLEPCAVNLVITDQIPLQWDRGRALSGGATRYRGFHVCVIALNYAHGNQLPFLSVNTCVHELLHALLQDIYEDRPEGLRGAAREFRIDSYATLLWLLHDGAGIRKSARVYVERLQSRQSSL